MNHNWLRQIAQQTCCRSLVRNQKPPSPQFSLGVQISQPGLLAQDLKERAVLKDVVRHRFFGFNSIIYLYFIFSRRCTRKLQRTFREWLPVRNCSSTIWSTPGTTYHTGTGAGTRRNADKSRRRRWDIHLVRCNELWHAVLTYAYCLTL
jgi:hypothetical protein